MANFYADYSNQGEFRSNVEFPTLDQAIVVLTAAADKGGAISSIRDRHGNVVVPDSELFTPVPLLCPTEVDAVDQRVLAEA